MLSKADAWKLMTAIKHLDHRKAEVEDAILFASIINKACDPTLGECLDAVGQWFGVHHDFGQIQPGDVADTVKARRPASKLTVNQINQALIEQGLSGDELWIAARKVRPLVNKGKTFEQAVSLAATVSRGHEIPAPPPKQLSKPGHHFVGAIGSTLLSSIIGKKEK